MGMTAAFRPINVRIWQRYQLQPIVRCYILGGVLEMTHDVLETGPEIRAVEECDLEAFGTNSSPRLW